MMSESFEAYWERLCKSTPPLRHEQNNMTQEIAKFKECLRRAYQAGKGSQVSRSEAADDFGRWAVRAWVCWMT